MDKEQIRQFGFELGVDEVGFAAVADYDSKSSPDPKSILPGVASIIVMGYRENDGAVESGNHRISMASALRKGMRSESPRARKP